jgi:hypothetical protein
MRHERNAEALSRCDALRDEKYESILAVRLRIPHCEKCERRSD